MSSTTVAEFASELKKSTETLLDQLKSAGVPKASASDALTDGDKQKLLSFLQASHGTATADRKKITLVKKSTSEIKQADATGKARTIQVEVRKKRTFIKRDDDGVAAAETATVHEDAHGAAPLIDEAELSRREEEARRQAELIRRQEEELAERRRQREAQEAREREQVEQVERAEKAAAAAAAQDGSACARDHQRGRMSWRTRCRSRPTRSEVIKQLMKLGQMVTINQPLDQDTAMIVVEEMGTRRSWPRWTIRKPFTDEEVLSRTAESFRARRWSPSWVTSTTARPRCWTTSAAPRWRRAKPVASPSTSAPTTSRRRAAWCPSWTPRVTRPSPPCVRAVPGDRHRDSGGGGRRRRDAADQGSHQARQGGGVPIVVAINKIDKPDANPERVKQELVVEDVVPEEFGGDSPFVAVSAKTGRASTNCWSRCCCRPKCWSSRHRWMPWPRAW
jgi:hypothetical protein